MEKKIVHVAPLHGRYDVRIFQKECRSLVSAGYSVTLVVADNLGNETTQGVHIEDVGLRDGIWDRYIGSLFRALSAARAFRPEIVHFHDAYLLPFAIVMKFWLGRVIYDVHEDMPRQSLAWRFHPAINRLISVGFSALEYVSRLVFSHYVCATPHIASRFPRSKTTTIQNYPIIDEFNFVLPKDPKVIAYIGSVSTRRGLAVMSEAITLVNVKHGLDLALYIAGPMANDREQQLLIANPHIHYLGNLDRRGVRDLLDRAAVGLCVLQEDPNFRNSKPVKMYEYLASGQSVVVSNFPYWQDLFSQFETVHFVEKSSSTAVAEKIIEIIREPQSNIVSKANFSRNLIRQKYSWESQELELLEVYYSTLA